MSKQQFATAIRNILSEEALIITALQASVPGVVETGESQGVQEGSQSTHLRVLQALTDSPDATDRDELEVRDVPDDVLIERTRSLLEVMPEILNTDVEGLQGASNPSERGYYVGALTTWSWIWEKLEQAKEAYGETEK